VRRQLISQVKISSMWTASESHTLCGVGTSPENLNFVEGGSPCEVLTRAERPAENIARVMVDKKGRKQPDASSDLSPKLMSLGNATKPSLNRLLKGTGGRER
jgi:hypothetical protein